MAETARRIADRIDTGPRFGEADAIRLNNLFRGRDTLEMLRAVLTESLLGDVAVVSSFGARARSGGFCQLCWVRQAFCVVVVAARSVL